MKVLIIRFSGVSDILLTTPLIRSLRIKYPHAEIHYLLKAPYEDILQAHPRIDKFISFEGDLRDTVLALLEEHYDLVFDLQNSFRSWNITAMLKQAFNSNVRSFRVKKMRLRNLIYKYLGLNLLPDQSIAERYLYTAKKMDVVNDGQGLDYYLPEEEKIEQEDLPMSHSAGYISFVISTGEQHSQLPMVQWKALCEHIDYPIIIQGGKKDAAQGELLKQVDPIRIYNSCGKFSLHESADIIRYAKVVVANESDLMHIAAAYKRKIVALMDRRRVKQGFFPYYGFNNIRSTISPDASVLTSNGSSGNLNIEIEEITEAVKGYLQK